MEVEVLEQSLTILQLRQQNDTLRQAVDVLTRAHTKLSDDLTLKNGEIAQLESHCNDLKLQTDALSEQVNLTELKFADHQKVSDHCASQTSELSAGCVAVRDTNSAAASDIATLCCELDSHVSSIQQKQMTINDLHELLSAEREKAQTFTEQLAEEQNKLKLQYGAIVAASAENSDLTTQNASLQQKLEVAEKEHGNMKLSLDELREKADTANGELQQQLLCLQNDYQLNLQSLNIIKEKNEILCAQFDQLSTENANLKLQLLENENEQAEMRAKIEKLEPALQDTVTALTESDKMAKVYLCEKDILQNKLLDVENGKNRLHTELLNVTVLYQNSEKSLLEAQERLVRRDEQLKEKERDLAGFQQDTANIRENLIALQHELKCEESEKTERNHQMKTLREEIENLKEIVTTKNETVAGVLAAKEDNDKLIASLQLETEHLTGEKVSLEQQVRVLEDNNSSLQKDLSLITDSYEHGKKLITDLQLRVNQLCADEQNFSGQLSSLRLLCEQKDELISQLNSEKEEISHTVVALTQKAEADAIEQTADKRRIGELEEQISIVEDKMLTVSAENQVHVDELNMCKDVIEQQKQSVADIKHENEHWKKVISDFEDQSLQWRNEKGVLESRIRELENYVTIKDAEVQAVEEMEQVAQTINQSESAEVSNKFMNDTEEHHLLQKCEIIQNIDAVEQKSEESEMENNVCNDCVSVNSLRHEPDSEDVGKHQILSINVQEMCEQSATDEHDYCSMIDIPKKVDGMTKDVSLKVDQVLSSDNELEHDLHLEVDQVYSRKQSEEVNLQPVISESTDTQQIEYFESAVKGALESIDSSDILSKNDVNVAGNTSNADCDKQRNLNSAAASLVVSDSQESNISVGCMKDGSVDKEPSITETVALSNDAAVKIRDPSISNIAHVDTVNRQQEFDMQCGGKRKVIKRFTRLPMSSAASKHKSKPLSACSTNVPSLHTQLACSLDVNVHSVADAVKQIPDDKISPSNEESAITLNETGSATNLQAFTGNITALGAADGLVSDDVVSTALCTADVCPATETVSSKHLSELSFQQAVSECSQTNDRSHHNSENNSSITQQKCPDTQNLFINNENTSDNKSHISAQALQPSNKRLNADMSGDNAKKVRLCEYINHLNPETISILVIFYSNTL